MWVNIAAAVLDVATGFASGGTVSVLAGLNTVLRSITKEPITK